MPAKRLILEHAMNFTLDIKPLSINDAYRGRHFPTKAKTQYETALSYLLPRPLPVLAKYFKVTYRFYLVRFSTTDMANLEKVLTDCIVKRGIIPDDKYIIDMRLLKFPAKADRIEVLIEEVATSLRSGG